MNKYCRIAATKVFLGALAVFLITGVMAAWKPASEVFQRHKEIASFTGTHWVKEYSSVWNKVAVRLNELSVRAKQPANGSTSLVPVSSFGSMHKNPLNQEWASKRYRTNSGVDVGRLDYDVNYGFAVMTHPGGADPKNDKYKTDKKIMARVMRLPIEWYQELFKDSRKRGLYTADLAQIVLGPNSSLHGLGVNSIYIASETGMAAFYPATAELGRQEATDVRPRRDDDDLARGGQAAVYYRYYDPRTRPWYRAAVDETKRTEVANQSSGLSYEYLDYSDKVTLVRTAWKSFTAANRTYVIGIDLILYGDSKSETSIVGNVSAELGGLATKAARAGGITGLVFASPLAMLALLLLLGALPSLAQALAVGPRKPVAATYRFRRVEQPLYWRPDGHGTEEISDQRRDTSTVGNSIEGAIGLKTTWGDLVALLRKKLWYSTQSTNETKRLIVSKTPRGPKDVTERCVEEWSLDEVTRVARECRRCGSRVTLDTYTRTVSDMRVIHRDHDYIGIELLGSNGKQSGLFNERLARDQLAEHVSVGGEAADTFELHPPLNKGAVIPRHVAQLVDVSSHLEVARQVGEGRIGYRNGIDISFPLYGDSFVQAVADVWYIDRLIRAKKTDMLFTGTEIMRLLFTESEKEIYDLYRLYRNDFVHIVETAGKQLRYVTKSALPKAFEIFNKWDFAVLDYSTDQACVIVTDTGQGRQRRHREEAELCEGITGELSWRKADVEFYHQVFELMWIKKQDPIELIEKWEKGDVPVVPTKNLIRNDFVAFSQSRE